MQPPRRGKNGAGLHSKEERYIILQSWNFDKFMLVEISSNACVRVYVSAFLAKHNDGA